MENYLVFSFRSDFVDVCLSMYEVEYSSYGAALQAFYSLVGQYSTSFEKSSVINFCASDSPYLKKICVSNGSTSYYVYLQKLS